MNNECVSETLGDYLLVRLRGEVDLSWSQQVRKAILDGLGANGKVGVEMSEVSYIDSSGIAALVEGLQSAKSKGKQFGLVRGPQQVQRLLSLTGVEERLRFADTPAELLDGR